MRPLPDRSKNASRQTAPEVWQGVVSPSDERVLTHIEMRLVLLDLIGSTGPDDLGPESLCKTRLVVDIRALSSEVGVRLYRWDGERLERP